MPQPKSNGPSTLDERIVAALLTKDIASGDLAKLIAEVEIAITAAEQTAEAERTKALDPTAVVDVEKAAAAMTTATLTRDRLQAALPKLHQRHQKVLDAEEYAAWVEEFERVKPKHTAAVAKLKQIYIECVDKLVEALKEAAAVDAETRRVAAAKPYLLPQANGDGRNLLAVECAARGITGVGPNGCLSLMTELKLPNFATAGLALATADAADRPADGDTDLCSSQR